MSFKFADAKAQYAKDEALKEDDVKALMDWASKQPHLPSLNELQIITFLYSCYCSNESAKTTIDNFFSFRTHCPDVTAFEKIQDSKQLQLYVDVLGLCCFPKQTTEGYDVFYTRLIDTNPDVYHLDLSVKYFDMLTMLHFHQEGISKGQILIIDFKGVILGHLFKLTVTTVKKLMYYIQEAMPWRLKSVHLFNSPSFMDKFMAIVKPFMKKELMELIHIHEGTDAILDFVPKDCLPKNFGGPQDSLEVLQKKNKEKIINNGAFFDWFSKYKSDESKRPGKPRSVGDMFGIEGTFKKLDLD